MIIYRFLIEQILCGFALIAILIVSAVHADYLHIFVYVQTDVQLCESLESEEFLAMFSESREIYAYYQSLSEETPEDRMEKMEAYFLQQVQNKSWNECWNIACGIICAYHNRPHLAYPCLKRACEELDTKAYQAWFLLACLERLYSGNNEAAYRYIDRSVELASEEFLPLLVRGTFLEQDGKYRESIRDFTLCQKLMYGTLEILPYLAVNHIHLEEYDKAAAYLESFLNGNRAWTPDCCLYLAGCYLHLNQNNKALTVIDRAMKRFPQESAFPLLCYLLHDRKGSEPLPEKLFTPGIKIIFRRKDTKEDET